MFSRANIAFLHDVIWAPVSLLAALYLRVGGDALAGYLPMLKVALPLYTLVATAVFLLTGMHRGVWRYASTRDLMAISRAVCLSILVFLPLLFIFNRLEGMPRSLPLIHGLVLLMGLGGPRFLFRVLKDRRQARRSLDQAQINVLVVGADDQADIFIRYCAHHPDAGYRVVGIVSRDGNRVGREIQGVQVLGLVDDVVEVVDRLGRRGLRPQRIILSPDIPPGERVRWLLDTSAEMGLTLARLPRMTDFNDPQQRLQINPIAVEDLLGRAQVVLDRSGPIGMVKGRRVLITGAGGSIGSELVRQVADLEPARLVLVEASEYALYTIDMELAERFPAVDRRAVIANVRDRAVIDALFAEECPQLVFHAAALKHVPLVEDNPVEGVLTNAFGSRNIADACIKAGVSAMVMISTDKAVNPTNVMGATKRLAESYCQALDLDGHATRFITVRFGNVLGSTGSVVPRFQAQLMAGGPITVTHPDMERFFMTIREAVELVLQASALGITQHDQGKIYVLDMGKPVKIVDLARQMIRLAGLVPDRDVAIQFTGLRPGEKLFEEIFHGGEEPVPTARDGILLASPRLVQLGEFRAALSALEDACHRRDEVAALALVKQMVPEFERMVPEPA